MKSYIKWLLYIFFFFYWKNLKKLKKLVFLGLILRFSNLNVLHKGLLMQDWVFRLGFKLNKKSHLPNWCCLLSITVLFTHPWAGKKIGNQTFDNHWHMDYWLDTNCCYNSNATLWIRALYQQNLSNVSYGIVQNLFCAELWDLWNEVKVS